MENQTLELDGKIEQLVREAAAEYVRMFGACSAAHLSELAQIAEQIGDEEAAAIWRDIASLARSLLDNRARPPRRNAA